MQELQMAGSAEAQGSEENMNEKLHTTFSASVLRKKCTQKGNMGGFGNVSLLSITVQNGSKKDVAMNRKIARVSISPKIIKDTGWEKGDVIDLRYIDGAVCLFNSNKGAHLCGQASTNRPHLRFPIPEEYAECFMGKCVQVEAEIGRVAFVIR